ncbi:FlaA1/EpsC-like NDP-sugar epimerase [Pullulanibacillus pueri]|uniref:UDP-N-acetylglucosamine 4,6-dehydratase n=1 Tax=Pullulanibacillus pueri TaxID=1437324 RepID=A0A8J3ELM9_9BACL|nr:nucleoside-diphosphate sugar epimerase/dehydratase [Pullulanibacillus pueri]MBM7682422.1 FlaA1/EpsC-like NDP-sugar epimerase [Pullulanibacillus pueri]GGH81701.1 UDP-N-acetylglucosamine 4,6-dehydratase [Pullulanibacillus pueri]
MTYHKRFTLFAVGDSIIVVISIFSSYFLINKDFHILTLPMMVNLVFLLLSHHLLFLIYKLYKKAWEYASVGELLSLLKAVTFSIIGTALVQEIVVQEIFFRVLIVTWMMQMFLIGGSRFMWRLLRDVYFKRSDQKKRTLIIGAGSAGTMVVRQLLKNKQTELHPVAYIDDDIKKQHLYILGLPVVGGVTEIAPIVERMNIDTIIIAIPSMRKSALNNIFQECLKTNAKTQILPMLEDIVTGKVSVSQFRDVEVEDLLGREPVELDMEKISDYVTDKTILVTGAGGSIGSEICRQLTAFKPKRLVLVGHGENSIYTIDMELKERGHKSNIEVIPIIADLQDAERIQAIVKEYRPHVVYHAAAHKHVPLMEANPEEAVKNNVIGTKNIAEAANAYGVQTFVMISSDKAVNPTSVMGATKRLAEMIIQKLSLTSTTTFVAVRFGNVLGSRGSVIPLFKKQIQQGGPVTVTHPDMIRYFMTIPEASRLVIQAGAVAKGGEIFVLDMGAPVKIVDLAKNLIRLSGHSIEDIGITYSGIRPGEKLFEELLKKEELLEEQVFPKIYIGKAYTLLFNEIEDLINQFSGYDNKELREKLVYLANKKVTPALMSVPS